MVGDFVAALASVGGLLIPRSRLSQKVGDCKPSFFLTSTQRTVNVGSSSPLMKGQRNLETWKIWNVIQ